MLGPGGTQQSRYREASSWRPNSNWQRFIDLRPKNTPNSKKARSWRNIRRIRETHVTGESLMCVAGFTLAPHESQRSARMNKPSEERCSRERFALALLHYYAEWLAWKKVAPLCHSIRSKHKPNPDVCSSFPALDIVFEFILVHFIAYVLCEWPE